MLLREAWDFYKIIGTEEEEARHCGLVKFLQDNTHPSSDDIEALAKKMKIPVPEVEERMFALLAALVKGIGKHNNVPDEYFDEEQLKRGIEIEKEHTDNELVAKMIAKDHLMEMPDYYTHLEEMESKAKREAGEEGPPNPNRFSIRDIINQARNEEGAEDESQGHF